MNRRALQCKAVPGNPLVVHPVCKSVSLVMASAVSAFMVRAKIEVKELRMHFWILGDLSSVKKIAAGASIKEISRLRKRYGAGRWRRHSGEAKVQLSAGEIVDAEIHWYEASGIMPREFKIKRLL